MARRRAHQEPRPSATTSTKASKSAVSGAAMREGKWGIGEGAFDSLRVGATLASSPNLLRCGCSNETGQESVLRLQRLIGNRAVQRLIGPARSGVVSPGTSRQLVQRTPAPGRDFGTYKYCDFGITTPIPGFIKGMVTNGFDVDYKTGCSYVSFNAWSSVWELYDASNQRLDSDTERPFGSYTIPAEKLNSGTPSDGTSSKWSLWYRITRSNPWVSDDNDAYPYDYKTFDVYSEPIKDPRTTLTQEVGPVIWANNFTPAEDGASLEYSIATSTQRSTEDSQTTSVSGTVGGTQQSQFGFSYDGLTGGFSRDLNYSATASICRTHSVSVSTSKNETFTFHQPNLRGGITYRVTARPLYHRIDGSVQLIEQRDGVVSSGASRVEGGIRVLKGLDIRVDAATPAPEVEPTARKWGCTDVRCNVYKVDPKAKCPNRVTGNSAYIYGSKNEACKAAQSDANSKVPRGCNKRHCNCNTKCTQR
jgi:hypothetical protein